MLSGVGLAHIARSSVGRRESENALRALSLDDFFFQAEDGIRDADVTGVQTCALPISFGTELPYLVAMGAQACVFGPGDIRVAHRTGEFVPLAELSRAVEILAAAIERFAAA